MCYCHYIFQVAGVLVILVLFIHFLAALHSMQHLSSPNSNQTVPLAVDPYRVLITGRQGIPWNFVFLYHKCHPSLQLDFLLIFSMMLSYHLTQWLFIHAYHVLQCVSIFLYLFLFFIEVVLMYNII